jgi:hypothetical protein
MQIRVIRIFNLLQTNPDQLLLRAAEVKLSVPRRGHSLFSLFFLIFAGVKVHIRVRQPDLSNSGRVRAALLKVNVVEVRPVAVI